MSVQPRADDPRSHWHASAGAVDRALAPLPDACDVAVVGGGLLGAATAYWLARAGVAAVLLERGRPADGATGRNGGFMVAGTAESLPAAAARLGPETARAVQRLTLDNRRLLREVLREEQIDCDYREPGHLELALGAAQFAALGELGAALRAEDSAAEVLERAQVQRLIATPLGPEIAGGLLVPEDGLLHSARLIHGLVDAAARHGARICAGAPVERLQPHGDGLRIGTGRGELRARAAVIAVNAWTDELAPVLAGLVTPVRGQALAYEPAAPIFTQGIGAALTPTGEYWQQAPDGTIVIGGCRTAAPGHDVGVREQQPTEVVQSAIEGVLPRLFPELGGLRVARRWAGLMAFTADYLPVADRAPGLPGAWVVGGFCGHGMPFGMGLGRLLAQATAKGAAPDELSPYRIDRPTLRPLRASEH